MEAFSGTARSCLVQFYCISNLVPFKKELIFGNRNWSQGTISGKYVDCRTYRMLCLVTARTCMVWCNDHTLQTFLPRTTINKKSECYNMVPIHVTVQGQSVPDAFILYFRFVTIVTVPILFDQISYKNQSQEHLKTNAILKNWLNIRNIS